MKFAVVVLGVFGSFATYLYFALIHPLAPAALRASLAALLGLDIVLILWVPLVFWRLDNDEATPRQRFLLGTAFSSLGLLSFMFVFSLARDLASVLLSFSGATIEWRTPVSSLVILLASALAFLFGVWIAHFGVKLKRVDVRLPALPRELDGFKILQITDLHVGPTIRRGFVEKIARLSIEAEPDLVVVTGDVADGMPRELSSEIAPLAEIRGRFGNFYVPGNHEYYWDGPGWITKMRELGYSPLLNENRVVEAHGRRILIAGSPDPAAAMAHAPGPDIQAAIAGAPDEAYPKIFLCHQPKFAHAADEAGFDLQISGHTHGGQFLPWTLIAAWVHKFNYGLHTVKRMRIYVSRGSGYWGPPVRVGSPSEVTLLSLRQSAN